MTPYLSEIKLTAFTFAPKGWALCNGQTVSIQQNTALFSLLGTTYGGDGIQNFRLPDLRGRVIVGYGNAYALGQSGGAESVTLTLAQMPYHSHTIGASTNLATLVDPTGAVPAVAVPSVGNAYGNARSSPAAFMAGNTVSPDGGGQPHENRMPSTTLNYIIALQGIYPSRN
ncbi:MAG TPA: tail fiber protein [Fimbriimonadaceae bacterium]|jgi:microcystin-dependent protein